MPPEASCLWQKGRLIGKMYFDQDYYCKWTNKHRDGGLAQSSEVCVTSSFFSALSFCSSKIILSNWQNFLGIQKVAKYFRNFNQGKKIHIPTCKVDQNQINTYNLQLICKKILITFSIFTLKFWNRLTSFVGKKWLRIFQQYRRIVHSFVTGRNFGSSKRQMALGTITRTGATNVKAWERPSWSFWIKAQSSTTLMRFFGGTEHKAKCQPSLKARTHR